MVTSPRQQFTTYWHEKTFNSANYLKSWPRKTVLWHFDYMKWHWLDVNLSTEFVCYTLDPEFKFHHCLECWQVAWVPCWPPRGWQVSHSRLNLRICPMQAMTRTIKGIHFPGRMGRGDGNGGRPKGWGANLLFGPFVDSADKRREIWTIVLALCDGHRQRIAGDQQALGDGPRTLVKRNNTVLSPMKICDIGQKGHMYTRLKHTQTHTLQLTIMGQVLQVFCWFVKLGASFKRQLQLNNNQLSRTRLALFYAVASCCQYAVHRL